MGDNNDCADNNNGDANDSVKKPTKGKKDAFGHHFRGEYWSLGFSGKSDKLNYSTFCRLAPNGGHTNVDMENDIVIILLLINH